MNPAQNLNVQQGTLVQLLIEHDHFLPKLIGKPLESKFF